MHHGRYVYDTAEDGAVGKYVDIRKELEKLAAQRQGQQRPVYKTYQPAPAPVPVPYPYPYPYPYQYPPPPLPPIPQRQAVPQPPAPLPRTYVLRGRPRPRPYRRRDYEDDDDDAHEIYKLPPKYQYRYEQPRRPSYKIEATTHAPAPIANHQTREQEHAALKHQRLAAGVSFVALMLFFLFICCLLPLVYYLCRPKFKKKAGKFSVTGWIKKHLTPKEVPSSSESDDQMPDFEKDYRKEEALYHEPPTIHYPEEVEPPKAPRKPPPPRDGGRDPRMTSLHIQLKETPLEMSISEVEEETEYEYITDLGDIGKSRAKTKKYRSKSVPTTPASPMDRLKKRFSFGESTGSKKGHSGAKPKVPSSKNAPASTPNSGGLPFPPPATAGGTTEEDEEVIYNRYKGKPMNDVTQSKSTQKIIDTATTTTSAGHQRHSFDQSQAQSQSQPQRGNDNGNRRQSQSQSQPQQKNDDPTLRTPASPSASDDMTSESSDAPSSRPLVRRKPPSPPKHTPTQDFFENNMVKWP